MVQAGTHSALPTSFACRTILAYSLLQIGTSDLRSQLYRSIEVSSILSMVLKYLTKNVWYMNILLPKHVIFYTAYIADVRA